MTQTDDELKLVERAREGDQPALATLYRRYERKAYNLALRMTGNPADAADIVQDAFIKAFRALDGFKAEARFSTWLHRIVVNTVHDHLRRPQAEPLDEPELDRAAHVGPADGPSRRAAYAHGVEPITNGLSDVVRNALLSLDEGFRLAVILCDLLGFDYEEAAEILGVKQGTVKSRIFRARAELAERLRRQGYDPAPDAAAAPDPVAGPDAVACPDGRVDGNPDPVRGVVRSDETGGVG